MAKNTNSSSFRKIDVDQCEYNFKEDEDEGGPTGPDKSEVENLLNKGQYGAALETVLKNAPLGSKNQQIKDNALSLTLRVLLSIKPNLMEGIVNTLTPELIDVLMKYIYRGFENPSHDGSSGHLLVWHEKVYNVGGVGCIVRVLSDTRRV